jgi:DNA polymerase eta
MCSKLIAQHVATWREGYDTWAYRDDAAANIATDKVSLDPYRLESRKILALIKQLLPPQLQKVEKASIDEVFVDLSAQLHSIMLVRFPELANPAPYDDPTARLPLPSTSALNWQADALVDLDEAEEEEDPDWDDVAMLIGSEIVRDVRAAIFKELNYTCSAGIANNKMLSKLGSGHKKPNQQTVIRSRAAQHFLADLKFTKIRNLGGKLGDQVVAEFATDSVRDLLAVPLDQFKTKLGDETGTWLHNTIRGIDTSEVNSRTQIKSMLSAKSFRPTIHASDQAIKWLRIFVADIFARLVEEGVLEHKRRPRTIALHCRHAGQTRSRQSAISQGKVLSEDVLFELSKTLFSQILAEGSVWPCANLSLSVGGFEDGVKGNMGISSFLVKGEEAQMLKQKTDVSRNAAPPQVRENPAKKRRHDGSSIQRFFTRNSPLEGEHDAESPATDSASEPDLPRGRDDPVSDSWEISGEPYSGEAFHKATGTPGGIAGASYNCSRCSTGFHTPEGLQSHMDWHMAKDLQEEEERVNSTFAGKTPISRTPAQKGPAAATSRRAPRGGKLEQGQSRLKFG